jgi:hypothetical protein
MDPVIDTTLRAGLALLFVAAAGHKLRDFGRFRATLAAYRLLPEPLVGLAALLVVGLELGVVAALVGPVPRSGGPLGAFALLSVYAAAVAINVARGRRDLDCGCAGPGVRRPVGWTLVARNVVLASTALVMLAPQQARTLLWVDVLTVAGATAVLAALYTSVDRLTALAPELARLRGEA